MRGNTIEGATGKGAIVLEAAGKEGSANLRATVADNQLPDNAAPGVAARAAGKNTLELDLFGNKAPAWNVNSTIGTNLTGRSNSDVAAYFMSIFGVSGQTSYAQVLATALSVYATNATLDPTKVAAQYGFTVSGDGAGTATVNVGSSGDAFGVANNTTMTVLDLLLATDAQAIDGVLYNGNATKRNEANTVFSAVNQAGGL